VLFCWDLKFFLVTERKLGKKTNKDAKNWMFFVHH
jgi:hypothetical protein